MLTHKTLEFKLFPTVEQEVKLNEWLRILQWTWNRALGLMTEYRESNIYLKEDKTSYLAFPIKRWDYKLKSLVDLEIPEWKKEIEPKTIAKGKKELLVQPVKLAEHIPALDHLPTSKKNTPLVTLFGHRYHKDREIHYRINDEVKMLKYTDCPFKFIQGILITLSGSWIEFIKRPSEVSPPKFKSKKHPIKTLIHYNAEQIKIDFVNSTITPHKSIGAIAIDKLDKRLKEGMKFNPLKICKKASGWYMQITIEENTTEPKLSGLSCGIDPGKTNIVSLDNNFLLQALKPMKHSQHKLKRLQRQIARKGRMNNSDRKAGEPWLKSNNWLKLQAKVGKLHETVARQRRSFNHYYSTLLTDWFDLIFLGDYIGKARKAKKKEIVNELGEITGYEHNHQCVQKGHNKSTIDIALGQIKELIKTKAKEKGKVVIDVNEDYTSQVCPNCGHIEKKGNREDKSDNLSVRQHHCIKCGYTGDRDAVGAINIKLKGIAELLLKSDSELLAIENLERVAKGNIREYLVTQETKLLTELRGSEGSKFNIWRLIATIGIKPYLEHTTGFYSDTILDVVPISGFLDQLQSYYITELRRSTKTNAII
jgi:IS605 OrfB family transposase